MAKQYFDPSDSAALLTKSDTTSEATSSQPTKKAIKGQALAALHGINPKNKPVILPPKKSTPPQVNILQGGDFPPPGDPFWKQHPLVTEHKDGSLRQWGEDSTVNQHNQNVLPKQMLPPPPKKQHAVGINSTSGKMVDD